MPSSTAVIVFPLLAALLYTFSALLLKRSSELGVGLWRTTFVAIIVVAGLFSLLWLLGGQPVQTNLLWQPAAIALCLFGGQLSQFLALEKGDKRIVGVNCHTESISTDLEILRVSHQVEADQVAALSARRAARDEAAVRRGLDGLTAAVREGRNAIPAMLDAVRAEATLGEICGLLRTLWGEYREPAQF